jgi:ribosomal protein S8
MNKLSYLISLIKINLSKNKLIAKVPYSKLNINILKILYNEDIFEDLKLLKNLFFIS